jgi:hypothetical protein
MIFDRIKSSILLRPAFNEVLQNKPDLYGPFWIATTLIVVIIAASSLMQFFDDSGEIYNFDQLYVATCLVRTHTHRSMEFRSAHHILSQ